MGARQGHPRSADERMREGVRRRRCDAERDRCRAGLRRQRLCEGVPGRETDARLEDPPDLRRHRADPAHRHREAVVRVVRRLALALVLACSPSGPRDVAGENKNVYVQPGSDAGGAPSNDAYAYVARRPHGVVALAEAREINEDESHAIIEKLANDLETCASRLDGEHTLVEGAARIVALAQPQGPPALNVKLAPGGDVA